MHNLKNFNRKNGKKKKSWGQRGLDVLLHIHIMVSNIVVIDNRYKQKMILFKAINQVANWT